MKQGIRCEEHQAWKRITFCVFDACSPAKRGDAFEVRLQHLHELLGGCLYARVHPCERTTGSEDIQARLSRVLELGGEGLMLREPGSKYETRRSKTLQKVKTFTDDEALVVALEDGKGRNEGRLGAFLCIDRHGVQFKVCVVAHPHRCIIVSTFAAPCVSTRRARAR